MARGAVVVPHPALARRRQVARGDSVAVTPAILVAIVPALVVVRVVVVPVVVSAIATMAVVLVLRRVVTCSCRWPRSYWRPA